MNGPEMRILRSVLTAIHAVQDTVERIAERRSPKQDQQNPTPKIDVYPEVSIPPAITDYYKAENKERPQKDRRERERKWLGRSTFVAALAAAAFTGLTWDEVRQQTESVRKSAGAAETSANAARDTLDYMRKSGTEASEQNRQSLNATLKQGRDALDASIDTNRLDQRPWVGVLRFECLECSATANFLDRKSFMYLVTVKGLSMYITNSGKTPALDVTIEIRGSYTVPHLPIPSIESGGLLTDSRQRPFVLPPGAPPRIVPLAVGTQHQFDITRRHDVVFAYIVGRITYRDIYGSTHKTNVCLVNETGNGFEYCTEGNSMD